MKKIKSYSVLTLVLGLILISCQTRTPAPKVKEAQPVADEVEIINPKISDLDSVFKSQITNVYRAYSKLKDALVASDSAFAINDANAVLSNLNKVDMNLLKQPEAHQVWMSEKPLLNSQLNIVVHAKTLAEQRAAFLQISKSMINLIENFGTSQQVMVQFCPMADDFKGGYWLNNDMTIKNPYFGSKMLTCGSTKKIIN